MLILNRQSSALLLIDFQSRLMPALENGATGRARRRRSIACGATAPRSGRLKWSSSSGLKPLRTRGFVMPLNWSGDRVARGAHRVEEALQDVGGGDAVDDLGAALAGHVVR